MILTLRILLLYLTDSHCKQKCFLIDQANHRIGGNLLLNGIFVRLVGLVGQVGHQTRHKLPELCQLFWLACLFVCASAS